MTRSKRARLLPALLAATLALSACGDSAASRLNPFRWFSGHKAGPETLTPTGGFEVRDPRQAFPRLIDARWEPTDGGQLLVVTGIAPTKGWWDAALITLTPMPADRIVTDEDGMLRLIFVGSPPLPGTAETMMPADPRVDSITVARSFSNRQLAQIRGVAISGAENSLTLRP